MNKQLIHSIHSAMRHKFTLPAVGVLLLAILLLAAKQSAIGAWLAKTILIRPLATSAHVETGGRRSSQLRPTIQNVSPDTPNGTVKHFPSTAGLTLAVVGDESRLHAVSMNAGHWTSAKGDPWTQIPTSPPQAYSIAVDPNDSAHLAIGERDGDAVSIELNRSGVWESHDNGSTWSYIFNPFSQAGCRSARSQAVPAVAFSHTSTLFIATACGVGQRRAGEQTFTFDAATRGIGLITALAASESKVWARTENKLLISDDDGRSWSVKNIPSSIGGFNITFPRRGDVFSLAAFDAGAFMVCGYDPTPLCGNANRLLIYNARTDQWLLQPRQSNSGGLGCDGTGLGGRRFVKAFNLQRADLPNVIGQRLQLFVGVAQEVQQATGLNADGTVNSWRRVLAATCNGCAENPDPVHSDIWDFHLAPSGLMAWVANDGGVYEKRLSNPVTFAGTGWVMRNQGLTSHHAHTMTVLPTDPSNRAKLAYSTSDNDAWFWDPACQWQTLNAFGDANYSDGDVGNPSIALLSRNQDLPWLTGFCNNLPNGRTSGKLRINNQERFDDSRFTLQFVQTLRSESPTYPLLDAVLLQRLPLDNPSPDGDMVLIRHRQFANRLGVEIIDFEGWSVEANNLPAGTRGFLISGGHANPVYYLYTLEAGGAKLYKRTGTLPPPNRTQWQALNVPGRILLGGSYGPAFVNPYDPNQLFVLTDAGVKVSTNGGVSFQTDEVLTALITNSGKFPLIGNYRGGNSHNTPDAGSRANEMATLAHIAFNRDNPSEMVVAAPYTGVLYRNADGKWRSLSQYLPQPYTPVSDVGIADEAIYVATEGRSIFRLTDFRSAPVASYFQTTSDPAPKWIVTLRDTSQSPIRDAAVHLRINNSEATDVFTGVVRTDAAGRLFWPPQTPQGNYAVHLDFNGTADIAPASTSLFALLCPDDIVVDAEPGQCGASVQYSQFSDSIAVSHSSGSFFPVGITMVTASGVYGQSCSFKITVRDRERPVIQCAANIDAFSDPGKISATLNLSKPAATDNCAGVAVTGSRGDHQPLDAPYPLGDATITWTARDAAGNTASCQQKINVKTRADLQVFQIIPPSSTLKAGDLVTYKIKVANIGPSPALGVVLSHQQSSKVKLVSVTGAGTCGSTRKIICDLGTINPGAPAEIRLTVKLLEAGGWLSNVSVNADPAFTVDPNPNNNLSIIHREITP